MEKLKRHWTEFRKSEPGERFRGVYERRGDVPVGLGRRLLSMFLGMVVIVTGLVTYPVPGPPSTLMILVGSILIAQGSLRVARALDSVELRMRRGVGGVRNRWRARSRLERTLVGAAVAAFLLAAGFMIYQAVWST